MKKSYLLLLAIFITSSIYGQAQSQIDVYVDNKGVMRWKGSNEEVALFGVNYTTPFAYSYRAHKKLGISHKDAIDLDIAQMVRLGFNAFRVHVWDREISDRDGDLLKNEHLDLLDYLISELAKRNIKTIITPIAWWGTGWPEPDKEAPGFSQLFPKLQLVTNHEARKSQRNYLTQFIEHVNPYTNNSYKNEPSIIALEIINEPFHPENKDEVTGYVNEMVKVLRDNGYTKPIFYNISENWNDDQAQAVVDADIQGITFQWYPTGLVHNKTLAGNYLLNVNKYDIPSKNVKGFDTKAKMIYEFDAADIASTYMYPAMARSYREAGMQFATMFSYDPTQIAWSNTEYPTHFANLLYTPSKAIGLMIAAKIFELIPREKSFGNFPANNGFGDFRISHDENLSELNNDQYLIYSNSTNSLPKNFKNIKQIAGVGSSSIVKYEGTGAYFLDKLNEGVWRLEVNPDVLWLRDPFEQTSLDREVARLFWNNRKINISLPELGNDFTAYSLSENLRKMETSNNSFLVGPGIYLLANKSIEQALINEYSKPVDFLSKLYTPTIEQSKIYAVNKSNGYMINSEPVKFEFEIASESKIKNANLYVKKSGWRGFAKYALINKSGFKYSLVDSLKTLEAGYWEYCVLVETDSGIYTLPEKIKKSPDDWDFGSAQLWNVRIIPGGTPVTLFSVKRDKKDFVLLPFSKTMRYNLNYSIGNQSEEETISLNIKYDEKNEIPFALQHSVHNLMTEIEKISGKYSKINVKAKALKPEGANIRLVMLTKDGKSFSHNLKLTNVWEEIELPLEKFTKGKALIMPFSYPKFLPKYWNGINEENEKVDLKNLNFIQIICDDSGKKLETGFEIESIVLN